MMFMDNKFSYAIRLSNKNIIIRQYSPMNSCSVAYQVMTHIIKQGKDALHDHYIRKEKVPTFSKRAFQQHSQQIVIHGGYQGEKLKKYSHFTLKNDQIAQNIPKDNSAFKSTQVTRQHKSLTKSPIALKSSQYKSYSSKKKSRENTSHNVNPYFNGFPQQALKEKQNHLIKLQENKGSRIIVERAKLREEHEQDIMREKKRQILMKQYQQKLSNEAFQKERQDKQNQKQKILKSHLKKGSNNSFNFDNDGELMLFQAPNQVKSHYPPQATFKIDPQEFEQDDTAMVTNKNKFERHKSSDFNKRNEQVQYKGYFQPQRIRSARGQAFASSVLRTVNLSKISMNGSLAEIDAQQFMKRNDLFNNNHTRQTTSIPFMQAKIGTVYTQITNNQAVQSIKPPSSTTANLHKEDIDTQFRQLGLKDKAFGGLQRKYSRTARVRDYQVQGKEIKGQITHRVIKTTDYSRGNGPIVQRRPHTSINRGHITTANQFLVQSLLQ